MKDFAKILVSPRYGQIVVMLTQDDDDNPTVKFYYQPEDMGVCFFGPSFEENEQGEKLAEQFFSKVALENVEPMIELILAEDIAELTDAPLDFLAGKTPAPFTDEEIQRGSACGEGGCE